MLIQSVGHLCENIRGLFIFGWSQKGRLCEQVFLCSSGLLAACVHTSQPQHCSYFSQRKRSWEAGVRGSRFVLFCCFSLLPDVMCLSEERWFLTWNSDIVFTDLIRSIYIREETISVDQFLDSHKPSTLALQLKAHCYKLAKKGSCLYAV